MGQNKHVDLFKDMIPAVDLGLMDLWDAVTEEGRKEIKGDFWNLNRYISNVKSNNKELQEHFLLTTNEFYNKHWNDIQKHRYQTGHPTAAMDNVWGPSKLLDSFQCTLTKEY